MSRSAGEGRREGQSRDLVRDLRETHTGRGQDPGQYPSDGKRSFGPIMLYSHKRDMTRLQPVARPSSGRAAWPVCRV